MHKTLDKTKDEKTEKPRAKLYCVTTRLAAPDGLTVGTEENVWRHDLAEAEKVFRETPTLALLIDAGSSHAWDEIRGMTAEKKLTVHVFDVHGEEIPRHSGALAREAKTWKDLEDLIMGRGDGDE